MMVSASERDVEGYASMQPEGESDLKITQRVKNLIKFKIFMNRWISVQSRG